MSAFLDAFCSKCKTLYRFDPDKPYPPTPTCYACLYAELTTAHRAGQEAMREALADYMESDDAPPYIEVADAIRTFPLQEPPQ